MRVLLGLTLFCFVLRVYSYYDNVEPYTMKESIYAEEDLLPWRLYFNNFYAATSQRLPCIFWGVFLAGALVYHPRKLDRLRNPLLRFPLTLAALAALWFSALTDKGPNRIIFGIGSPLWMASIFYFALLLLHDDGVGTVARAFRRVLSARVFAYLMLPTYSVYLIHYSVINSLYGSVFSPLVLDFGHLAVYSVVVLALSFAYGTVVFFLVERPLDRLLKKGRRDRSVLQSPVVDANTSKPKAQ